MTKKSEKDAKKSRKEFLIALGLLLVLIAAVVFIIFILPKLTKPDEPAPVSYTDSVAKVQAVQAPEMTYEIPGFTMLNEVNSVTFQNGLKVLCAGCYTGAFLEDGTDEQVQDVLALIVQNTSGTLIEYGEITLDCGGKTAHFEFLGLTAGNSVLVQEKTRMKCPNSSTYGSFACPACALPGTIVLDFGNEFDVSFDDSVIVAKNKTDADIPGPVTVYYKNMEYGLYMGGITYSASFEDGIGAGEYAQVLPTHIYSDTSAIMYMRYAK